MVTRSPFTRLKAHLPALMLMTLPWVAIACSDDGGPGDPDGGQDARLDASTLDSGNEVVTEPLTVTQWIGAQPGAGNDLVYDTVAEGTFVLPQEGTYLGTDWFVLARGVNASVGPASIGEFWVAAHVTVPAGRRVFARADSIYTLFVNNRARQPGDAYHTRKTLVPLDMSGNEASLGTPGENLVVGRAVTRGANFAELELWSTSAEVVFNGKDVTAPNLVVGQDAEIPLGIHVLHLGEEPALDISARVVEDATFEDRVVHYEALAADAVTQMTFVLSPKAPIAAQDAGSFAVTLRLESPSWVRDYETTVDLTVVDQGARYRQTRISTVDGSTQYHAVMPPVGWPPNPMESYGLILSLHGAGVEASGQAAAYSPKDWAFLIAPTNRRPFGFDWEEWGRLDALEALDHAMATLPIDPTRVHLTGHSMGGHGSWHVGVHHAGRFGVVAPSAGWISFDLYTGPAPPTGMVGRARAHSQTLDFVDNLRDNAVYIIHGDADDNVPVSHAQQMFATLQPIVSELTYHEEPGAGHWWDLDPAEEGADCVDWDPMLEVMRTRNREVTPLDFHFSSSAPWVSSEHSFLRVLSATSPLESFTADATSSGNGTHVDLVTQNVRGLEVEMQPLFDAGVTSITVDGDSHTVTPTGVLDHGLTAGKHPTQYGPLNQLFHRRFCFVYDGSGPAVYRHYAAFLLSYWSIIGNGHGCAVSLADVTPALADERNLIYLGVPMADIANSGDLPFSWDADGVTLNGTTHPDSALAFLYPDGEKLAGFIVAAAGAEHNLYGFVPFSSRSGMPDYFVWGNGSLIASGFFDGAWQVDPAFGAGL